MHLKRLVIRNFRNFAHLDISLESGVTCIVGENNSGKTNLLHALRIVLDAGLSSQFRHLTAQDIHSGVDTEKPFQVVISVEFTNYSENDNQCALAGAWQVDESTARLTYRFRPRPHVIDSLRETDEPRTDRLILQDDFHWQIVGGGIVDPAEIHWDEDLGAAARFADLQYFKVEYLPAFRDMRGDIRQSKTSPLGLLFESAEIPQGERDDLIEIMRDANERVSQRPTISGVGSSIQKSLDSTAGEAFRMGVRLGVADPSFASVYRSLTLLLSDGALSDFEPNRNGLGLNNILFVSTLLEYFRRRVANPKTAGQLLLIEEPEAHLHPQLQRVLYSALASEPFQTILTTHSTHVSSQAPLRSIVTLTREHGPAVVAKTPAITGQFNDALVADLERYLDATRSTLLFARKVILVEGPAELFLVPPLVKQILHIDLDRFGITVIPIYGTHFATYTRLFSDQSLPKKCALIADADLDCEGSSDPNEGDIASSHADQLYALGGPHVSVFLCDTTFERALALPGLLTMLYESSMELGLQTTATAIIEGQRSLSASNLDEQARLALLDDLGKVVLKAAKRVGKARFAQVASKHADLASELPLYIKDAVEWLQKG